MGNPIPQSTLVLSKEHPLNTDESIQELRDKYNIHVNIQKRTL